MKRDMDLIRNLAFILEDHPGGFAPDKIEVEGFTKGHIGYHFYLMQQHGFIEGVDDTTRGSDGPSVEPTNLTWAGHEFVANARNDAFWNKTKLLVKEKGGSVSFSIFVEVLKKVVASAL